MFATILLTSLIRSSEKCKKAAQKIVPSNHPTGLGEAAQQGVEDDDPPQTLLATLVGSVALALRSRSQAKEQGSTEEIVEWDRVIVAYLSLLCIWGWDYPEGVKDVLEEGGALGVVCSSYFYS